MDKKAIQEKVDKLKAELDGLNKLLKEKEQRFYKGQPVLVSDNGIDWGNRYFSHISESGCFVCYGRKNITHNEIDTISWDHCKPDPDAPSLLNWIEWEGGECPVEGSKKVVVEYRCGTDDYKTANQFGWEHHKFTHDIIRYAVITKPEFI